MITFPKTIHVPGWGILTWVLFLYGDPDLLDALIHFFMSF